jgi:hypothetical protein
MRRVWFHLIVSTYGSWLPGNPRGFRTWNHHEHVEGDYKNPPPEGEYDLRHIHAKNLQKHDAVIIPPTLRPILGEALRDRLTTLGGRVLSLAVCGQHGHLQVQLDDGDARLPLGLAKKHAWFIARDHGWNGKLWAKRPKVIRIRSKPHQLRVYRYILAHEAEGAWVWSELRAKQAP